MKSSTILAIVLLVVGLGAGFFGGTLYQKNMARNSGNRSGGNFGQGRSNNGAGRPVVGDIISQDNNSLTIKLADGSSRIVVLSGSTIINKSDQGSIADLKTGERVAAFGIDNSDGSLTAQNVQINPMFRIGATGTPSASPQ